MRLPKRSALMATSLLFAFCLGQAEATDKATSLESTSTCRKKARFTTEQWLLGRFAKIAKRNGTRGLPEYISGLEAAHQSEPFSLRTVDGRLIHGRRASFSGKRSSVAVLIASGNVATADAMLRRLEPLVKATGYDFYFLDYRGYGRSGDSHPSMQALFQDFVALGKDVRSRGYSRVLAYGPSLGGIVLLNAAARGLQLDRLIIDSLPSDLAGYKCDESIWPTTVLPASCPGIVAISGRNDDEVEPDEQQDLLGRVRSQSCGGHVAILTDAGHALNDAPGSPGDQERMNAIGQALREE